LPRQRLEPLRSGCRFRSDRADGAGKSDWAIRLANEAAVEIVSVDSALVYRGLDIGSAKPPRALRERIPHHLIDICEPTESYSPGSL
jgi:tRNA dimethylallyltransferase